MPALPDPLVSSRSEWLGGTPCFHGTRVPVKNLFDYLLKGYALDEFLLDFPTIGKEHAVAILAQASERATAAAKADAYKAA